jgi:hypothetical protein
MHCIFIENLFFAERFTPLVEHIAPFVVKFNRKGRKGCRYICVISQNYLALKFL